MKLNNAFFISVNNVYPEFAKQIIDVGQIDEVDVTNIPELRFHAQSDEKRHFVPNARRNSATEIQTFCRNIHVWP
ncbi:hypothetical protein SCD_n02387 [Sulfuricella denitrificans skB26]|uniref:Uncharacterized protein n=1 Tax=Sulfuricella denitrificans (strain DSM 22764 / NBRC 105220 / skB26) TaxID=1163617 RepID=S6AAS3_SULDS|nr:hypothetical protein [Sulfuricella denitrificans]BAN36195.1 hypothetical protein SCD_n02387 [Sulfuricella denitrificans skB26]